MWRQLPSSSVILLAALALVGCTPMRFSQYSGPAYGYYPNSFGSMAETSYKLPVYRTWPDRPFKIIGSVRFEDAGAWWNDDIIGMAASEAKIKGGDAIIIRLGSEYGVGKIVGMASRMVGYATSQTTALVVRWLDSNEVAVLDKTRAQAAAILAAEQPDDFRGNAEVEQLALQLVLQQNAPTSIEALDVNELVAVLIKISSTSPTDFNGEWIYKGSLEASNISGQDQDSFLGTAIIRMVGDRVTIVSDSGKTEVNFNGNFDKGGLAGQLGISGFAVKADGAAVEGKISLSFQTRTADGLVKGNITFQRLILKNKPSEPRRTPGLKQIL